MYIRLTIYPWLCLFFGRAGGKGSTGNTPRLHFVSGTLRRSDCDHMFMLYILPLLVTRIDGVRASVRGIPYICFVVQLRSFFKAVAMHTHARNLTRGFIREKKSI